MKQTEQGRVENESKDQVMMKKSQDDKANAESELPSKKKRKWKDLSNLPPEERERRERQRIMQMEAAVRRANGDTDNTRHPLNSERRRANRRKPGRTGKIALLKKQSKLKQEYLREFNASGFHMRRSKTDSAEAH